MEKYKARARRIEWEHAVPAEHFGRAFVEWREGSPQCVDTKGQSYKGRACAQKTSKLFRLMHADMYNLFPAVGAINGVRGKKRYAEIAGRNLDGMCPIKVEADRFEPPDYAKGEVARASLYMDMAYAPQFRLGQPQKRLMENWNQAYPVSRWECIRAKRIERIQGNENPYVKRPCQAQGWW